MNKLNKEQLQSIVDNAPDGATHYAITIAQQRYLKHNVRREFVYHDGRTFCAFPSKSGFLKTCVSIRSLSDIKTIIEQQEEIEKMKDIVEAAAHVGIDFGYGVYELQDETIKNARELYEKIEGAK